MIPTPTEPRPDEDPTKDTSLPRRLARPDQLHRPGKRHRPSAYVDAPQTRAGLARAQIAKAALVEQWMHGIPEPETYDPGAELFARWLTAKRGDVQPKTFDAYRRALNRVPDAFRRRPVGSIRPADIEDLTRCLIRSALSHSTAIHTHTAMSGAFGWASRRGELRANPVETAERPRKAKSPV